MCVFLCMLHSGDKNTHSTSKMNAFLGTKDILAAANRFKGLLETWF